MVELVRLRTLYELPFLVFRISVFVLILRQVRRKRALFATAFYLLFLLQGCAMYLGYSVVSNKEGYLADLSLPKGIIPSQWRAGVGIGTERRFFK